MKEKRYDTIGGLSAPVLEYESYDEAEKVVPGALLDQANSNMVYRQVLPAVRELICNKVEEETGITRESKVIGKTKAGKDILQWEADKKYVDRVLQAKGKEDFKELQTWVDENCRAFKEGEPPNQTTSPLAVDVKGTERKAPVSAKLAARYKIIAAKKLQDGPAAVEKFNTDFLSKIGKSFVPTDDTEKMYSDTVTVTNNGVDSTITFNVSDKDAEALGRLVKEYLDWVASQAAATL